MQEMICRRRRAGEDTQEKIMQERTCKSSLLHSKMGKSILRSKCIAQDIGEDIYIHRR